MKGNAMKTLVRLCYISMLGILGLLYGCGGGGDSSPPAPTVYKGFGRVPITPDVNKCQITVGKSACTPVSIEWTTVDAPGAKLEIVPFSGATLSGPAFKSFPSPLGSELVEMPFGTWDVNLTYAGGELVSKPLDAVCGTGLVWSGSTCEIPAGLIGVIECRIPTGGTTCVPTVNYSTISVMNPAIYVTNYQGVVVAQGFDTSGKLNFTASYGKYGVSLYDGQNRIAYAEFYTLCTRVASLGGICT